VIDDFAKEYLHSDLREIREVMLWKLDGLAEYDVRCPLTSTGTNLLGLVKHLSISESRRRKNSSTGVEPSGVFRSMSAAQPRGLVPPRRLPSH
jgi:hypothetical protein